MKLVEFLYFYLMPETPFASNGNSNNENSPSMAERMHRSPSKRLGRGVHGTSRVGEAEGTRTTEEKQSLLGRYLNNVEDLVEDLRETAPFGAMLT